MQQVQEPCISIEGACGECFLSHQKWQKAVPETSGLIDHRRSESVIYLYKDTAMAIMEEVNRTADTSTEVVEEAAYVGTIPTSGTEVIDKFTGVDPGYPAKRLKTCVPPDMETILDPVISMFITARHSKLR